MLRSAGDNLGHLDIHVGIVLEDVAQEKAALLGANKPIATCASRDRKPILRPERYVENRHDVVTVRSRFRI